MRAITTAWMVNESNVRDLAMSIDALRRVIAAARENVNTPLLMPSDLPSFRLAESSWRTGGWWFGAKKAIEEAIDRLRLSPMSDTTRSHVVKQLLRHWATVHDWVRAINKLPRDVDPTQVLQARLREVILRTDLWSDQLVVLRTLQTLSLLDVYHYCRVVWNLGGYGERDQVPFPAVLPAKARRDVSPAPLP